MYVDNPRKKHHFFRKFLLSLLLVIVLFVGICCVIGQPKAEGSDGSALRRPGVSTILLAGTDEAGYRTDTIILMTVDSKQDTVSLLSIPRDKYTEGYAVPKINSACGAAGVPAGRISDGQLLRGRESCGYLWRSGLLCAHGHEL